MNKVFSWFATSPLSTAARVAIGAGLAYIVDNIGLFNLSPVMQVAVIGVVASAIRYFNPADGVYGKNATEVTATETTDTE